MEKSEDQISLYEMFGGEEKLKLLVSEFYKIMDTNPNYKTLREMHPEDLSSSEEKLFMFLSGWMGGPQLYITKYGHPRLRARHMPFPITQKDSKEWVNCMTEAIEKVSLGNEMKTFLTGEFDRIASFMVNKI